MIIVEEGKPIKLPTLTSLKFSSAGFYDKTVWDLLRQADGCYFDKKTNTFEFPPNALCFLVDVLCTVDDVKVVPYYEDDAPTRSCGEMVFKVKPYNHQLDAVNYGLNHNGWLLLDDQGLGKAIDLNTVVFTPDGYKKMVDIHPGDFVFNQKGLPVKVLNEFFVPNADMYEITFSDDTSIKCCKDHLWKIYDQHGAKVVPTEWFLANDQFGKKRSEHLMDKFGIYKYHIDLCEPVQFTHRDVVIDPYLFGCLVGDGCFRQKGIGFTSADAFIVEQFEKRLPSELSIRGGKDSSYDYRISRTCHKNNIYLDEIRRLGLGHKKSGEKFIPDLYKYNDFVTRLDVIRGLMDTDGTSSSGNCVQYSTISAQLANDVVFLVQSIGGMATIASKKCGYRKGGVWIETGVTYTVSIRYKSPQDLFNLPRKKNLLGERKFLPRRNIVDIHKIPNSDAKCIKVDDASGLYLIENFVVTHNTTSMIYLAETLKRYENLEHCFIICGVNGLKFNWASEIEKFSDLSWHILGQRVNRKGNIVIGSVEDRLNDLRNPIDEFFVITNIETLQNKNFAQAFNSSKNHFDMIILDEAHRCKSPSALSVKTLLKVKAKRCIALTGTVIVNNPENAYVPLKWTGNTNSNYSQFSNMYNVYGGFGGVQVLGHKNLDLLKQLLASCSLRRLKSDVLDLPDKTYITDYVDMYDDQRKLYLDVHQGIVDELNKLDHKPSIMEEITINMRLRQITAYPGMLSTEVTNSAKIERMVQLVQDIVAQGDKVVVFSTFKGTIYEIERRLKDFGLVVCTGDYDDAHAVEAINKFQTDDSIKVFAGTWQKAGTGITLTAASYMIFIDTPWTSASFEQACDRIYRIGQDKKVFIITLITKDTYDERVQEILQRKEDLSKFIVDNGDDKNLSLYE